MESIIVRVYRRSRSEPGEIAGLVETVGIDEKKAFQTFSGLINTLRNTIFPADNYVTDTNDHNSISIPEKKQAV
jgi:hypothetical protein